MRWQQGKDLCQIALCKSAISRQPLSASKVELPPPAQCLEHWLDAWAMLFARAMMATTAYNIEKKRWKTFNDAKPKPFDFETIQGIFTRDSIKAALTPYMPYQQSHEKVAAVMAAMGGTVSIPSTSVRTDDCAVSYILNPLNSMPVQRQKIHVQRAKNGCLLRMMLKQQRLPRS